METGRYTATDLDLTADEIRDQAITMHGELMHNKPHLEEAQMLAAAISASVALADFLHKDAARLRRIELSNTGSE